MREDYHSRRANKIKKEKSKWRKFGRILLWLTIIGIVLAGAVGLYAYVKYEPVVSASWENSKKKMENINEGTFNSKKETVIYDKSEKVLTELAPHDYFYVESKDIPLQIKNGVIAIEDVRFLEHDGIDYKAIARAGYALVKNKGTITQGGSTITQQLVKNVFLTNEQTYSRKLEEVFIAVQLEKIYTKEKILEFYLNNVYFGSGAYGIESASRHYLSKEAKDLTLSESTFLIAITNNPTKYHPVNNKENTLKRRDLILEKMKEHGFITETEYREAILADIELKIAEPKQYKETYAVSYAISDATKTLMKEEGFKFEYDFTSNQARAVYKDAYAEKFEEVNQRIRNGGYIIYTSLESDLQEKVQSIVNKQLSHFKEKDKETGLYKRQGAVVIIDNETGYVRALSGGRTQEDIQNTFNRAFLSYRQPGSTIKPIVAYTPAIEQGYLSTTIVNDKALNNGPRNVDNRFHGKVPLREALVKSYNTIPFQLIQQVGVPKSLKYLKNLEFNNIVDEDNTPVVAIGGFTYGATPMEMAGAYSTLARNGEFIQPTSITKIVDISGTNVFENNQERKRVYDTGASYLMTNIMEGVAQVKNAKGVSAKLNGFATATKSGTTNGVKDIWYAGYTPSLTAVVWIGEDMPKAMKGLLSTNEPLYLWKEVMEVAHLNYEKKETFDMPTEDIDYYYVNPSNGKVSKTKKNGWVKQLVPTLYVKKIQEKERLAKIEADKKAKELAVKQAEQDKLDSENRKKAKEAEEKALKELNEWLIAKGSSLQLEESKEYHVSQTVNNLKSFHITKKEEIDEFYKLASDLEAEIGQLLLVEKQKPYLQMLADESRRLEKEKQRVLTPPPVVKPTPDKKPVEEIVEPPKAPDEDKEDVPIVPTEPKEEVDVPVPTPEEIPTEETLPVEEIEEVPGT